LVVAPDHVQPPSLIQAADVTGGHEAAVKVLARPGGIAAEAVGVAHEDLTDFTGGHLFEIVVEYSYFGPDRGLARGVRRCPQVDGGGGGDHAGFGGVVVVVDDVAELVHEPGDDVGTHPGPRRGGEPQRTTAVATSHLVGQVHDSVEHHRHHAQAGGLVTVDEFEGGLRVELATGDHRAAH